MEKNNIANLIVHPNYAKRISSEINTQKSERIMNNIKKAISSPNSYIIKDGIDPRKIPDILKKYDKIKLYGAMHGYCLTATGISLTIKGINHTYAQEGYF